VESDAEVHVVTVEVASTVKLSPTEEEEPITAGFNALLRAHLSPWMAALNYSVSMLLDTPVLTCGFSDLVSLHAMDLPGRPAHFRFGLHPLMLTHRWAAFTLLDAYLIRLRIGA